MVQCQGTPALLTVFKWSTTRTAGEYADRLGTPARKRLGVPFLEVFMDTITQLLQGNSYPGRGIVLGVTPDGTHGVAAYFIMGRSENSRNRVFSVTPDGIRTQAHDPEKMTDPHLIIYHPVRQVERRLIVTNGDQTDTLRDCLLRGEDWQAGLRRREFEDDAPNWTPRISGIQEPDGSYKLSVLKAADPEGTACLRFFYEYPARAGVGHFISTYLHDGAPLPSFQGEPRQVAMTDDLDGFTDTLWNALDKDNKISLFVRYTDLDTGAWEQRVVNKHGI